MLPTRSSIRLVTVAVFALGAITSATAADAAATPSSDQTLSITDAAIVTCTDLDSSGNPDGGVQAFTLDGAAVIGETEAVTPGTTTIDCANSAQSNKPVTVTVTGGKDNKKISRVIAVGKFLKDLGSGLTGGDNGVAKKADAHLTTVSGFLNQGW